ncbi:MAG: outer membrane beta-barrel protein [Bdellovibrio sp.]
MIKNFLTGVSFALTLGFATQASAGFLVEPYLGYESSESKIGTTTSKLTGPTVGLRLGYKLPVMAWFAVDYSMITGGDAKPEQGSSSKLDSSNLYLDVGLDLPVLARIWAGYGVQRKYTTKPDSGNSIELTLESPIKVGVGFTFLPMISVNLEYFMSKAKESKSGSTTTNLSSTDPRDNNGLIISVSAPFNL